MTRLIGCTKDYKLCGYILNNALDDQLLFILMYSFAYKNFKTTDRITGKVQKSKYYMSIKQLYRVVSCLFLYL